jgi:hypothetical protein
MIYLVFFALTLGARAYYISTKNKRNEEDAVRNGFNFISDSLLPEIIQSLKFEALTQMDSIENLIHVTRDGYEFYLFDCKVSSRRVQFWPIRPLPRDSGCFQTFAIVKNKNDLIKNSSRPHLHTTSPSRYTMFPGQRVYHPDMTFITSNSNDKKVIVDQELLNLFYEKYDVRIEIIANFILMYREQVFCKTSSDRQYFIKEAEDFLTYF